MALPQEVGAAPHHLTAMGVKERGVGTSRRMCSSFFFFTLMLTKAFAQEKGSPSPKLNYTLMLTPSEQDKISMSVFSVMSG